LARDREGKWQGAEVVGIRREENTIEDDEEEATRESNRLEPLEL
jgi:hypothetical protein